MKTPLPSIIATELEPLAGYWHIEDGGKHRKLIVFGRLVGVMSFGALKESRTNSRNLRSNIRRIARQHKGLL